MRSLSSLPLLCATLLLTACGGGFDESDTGGTAANSTQSTYLQETGAPQPSGNTASDGFNWTNFRRQQLGLSQLRRSSIIDEAAQGHSAYQQINNIISHEQDPRAPGFTGVTMGERLAAVGYVLRAPYAFGEVIAATGGTSGINAAEDLITAIYHRFVMFEPRFREAGAGAATVRNGYTYFTLNLATTNGLGQGVGSGQFVTYPFANQTNVLTVFNSNFETPDPVPDRNEVGYPVSIHADINATVMVQTFTIAPRGGSPLPVKLLTSATDSNTPESVAAIVPLPVLAAKTTYDVQFVGTVDGIPATRSWSFTTR
jgi:uncharacterized protein YkwD